MDSKKGWHAGVEKIETNLKVEAEFAKDERRGRKSSPKVRRSSRIGVAARKTGRYNQHVKGYAGIYIGLGF